MTSAVRRALCGAAAAALAVLGTVAASSPAGALGSESCPNGDGWVRVAIDGASSVTVEAPAGTLIIDTCIAAGGETTYLTFDPGTTTLTVSGPVVDSAGVPRPVDHCSYRATSVPATPPVTPAPAAPPAPLPAPEVQATVHATSGPTATAAVRPRAARPSAATTVLDETATALAETGIDPALPATALALVLGGTGLVLLGRRDARTAPERS